MKALVGAFNQEKALVGAFSVIVQLHRLIDLRHYPGPFTEHKLAVAALDWSRRVWAGAQFTVLARDSLLVNTAAVSGLAARHAVSGNRVLGALYKRYSPARAPGAPHHTPAREWPWRLYPPFLGPHLAIFSQD